MIFHRRNFLQGAAMAVASGCLNPISLLSVEPFNRKGEARLLLSLAAYSFRDYMKDSSHARENGADASRQIDLFQFIDYCADQKWAAAELTSYYFPKNAGNEFILQVKRHCFLRGVEISGTSVGNTFTHPHGNKRDEQMRYVKQWIDFAALMGAPHLRVFAGSGEGQSKEAATKNCIAALEECCDYAGEKGIFLGIENHGGIVAEPEDLLKIVRTVQSKWLGINLDSANFHTDDPYADFERCAEFAVNVQIKTEVQPKGKSKQPSDLGRYLSILKRSNYHGYVVLEYEAREDPYESVPKAFKVLRSQIS
ncbi:MAG: sugar phosphate isomerase/epimerase family protein [Verrucomicrobiales bacterium]